MTTSHLTDHVNILPGERDVGRTAVWRLPAGDDVLHVEATFLGVGTSYSDQHVHPLDRYPEAAERCRACRWFEPRIFREVDGQRRYIVHRTGCSKVPGEVMRTSYNWIRTANEVVEVLTTRRRDQHTGNRVPYLSYPAARVLAQAASYDDELNQAYIDRAVA